MAGGLTQRQQDIIHEGEQLLHEARYDPHFAETMRGRGYDEASWAHGQVLLEAVKATGRAFEQAQSAKLGATNTVKQRRDQMWTHSSTLSQSCVALFQGQTDYLNALGLHGGRKDSTEVSRISKPKKQGKVEHVLSWQRNLFEVAQNHTGIAPVLAANGFPAEILAQGAAAVEVLVRAEHEQEQAKANVSQRRIERDAAYKVFRTWLRCTQRIAHLAKQERTGGGILWGGS
ncbi:MAG: hypothetical protein H6631_05560 [Anaerolineaceae bacterium]|nr:hypothetical protein [Anaerolineaceae bacterium]